jgi:hypothetical protein
LSTRVPEYSSAGVQIVLSIMEYSSTRIHGVIEYSSTRVPIIGGVDRDNNDIVIIIIRKCHISLQLFNYTIDIDNVTPAIIVAMSCIYKFIDNKVDNNEY